MPSKNGRNIYILYVSPFDDGLRWRDALISLLFNSALQQGNRRHSEEE
jgi:hypothetical protein